MKLTEKLNTLLAEYKAKFGSQELKFVDAKLNDGVTVVRMPNMPPMKGDVITVITEQGELPLSDNIVDEPYVLEDGTIVTIVGGLVDSVIVPEEPKENEVEVEIEPMAAEPTPAPATPKRVIKSQVEEHVFSVELENEIIEFDFTAMFKKQAERIESLESINLELSKTVKFLADEPATESVENLKVAPKDFSKMSELELYRYFKRNG